MIRAAVIGYGYWGPNLARVLDEHDDFELVAIADSDPGRRARAMRRHPRALAWPVLDPVVVADAVFITTPPATHHALALHALEAGRHVLVAKPLALNVDHARELAALAEARGLVLMVDHTFVHTGAVRRLRELAAFEIGRPLYYDSTRVNLGLIAQDTDVVWDLAPHDLSILRYVLAGDEPVEVSCHAEPVHGHGVAVVAWLTVWYRSGFVAHAHLSWLSPVKVRRALLAGDGRMVVYDDMEPSEKLRAYDAGATVGPDELVDYRTGDCWAPHLDRREALAVELDAFAALVAAPTSPSARAAALDGVEVVRVLEAATRSAASGGCRVPV